MNSLGRCSRERRSWWRECLPPRVECDKATPGAVKSDPERGKRASGDPRRGMDIESFPFGEFQRLVFPRRQRLEQGVGIDAVKRDVGWVGREVGALELKVLGQPSTPGLSTSLVRHQVASCHQQPRSNVGDARNVQPPPCGQKRLRRDVMCRLQVNAPGGVPQDF